MANNLNITIVVGEGTLRGIFKVPYKVNLCDPTLDQLDKTILGTQGFFHKYEYARTIFLRDVPLTDDSICRMLKNGATYRVLYTTPFASCPEMCDVYLFKVI